MPVVEDISTPVLELVLPAGPMAPSVARRALVAKGLDPDLDHTVSLLVSELVTNAIRHSEPRGIGLRAYLARDYARVEVRDTGPGFDAGDPDLRRGLGLRLLDKLAGRWGAEPGEFGCVWFEVDRRPTEQRTSQRFARQASASS
ncbi:MAG TPA: ATP-binding protein [Solirubrobacteraceae bacterium]|nr:ATP-binding protein [Solirubrobacteraceae bacterium]